MPIDVLVGGTGGTARFGLAARRRTTLGVGEDSLSLATVSASLAVPAADDAASAVVAGFTGGDTTGFGAGFGLADDDEDNEAILSCSFSCVLFGWRDAGGENFAVALFSIILGLASPLLIFRWAGGLAVTVDREAAIPSDDTIEC